MSLDPQFAGVPRGSRDRKSPRPRLTGIVLSGLATMAGVAEAGECCDFLGNDAVDHETRQNWREVLRACQWIRAMQHRATVSEEK